MKVHLVGGVGLPTVDDVLSAVGKGFGSALKRMPDGEPHGRRVWVSWQYPVLIANPGLGLRPAPSVEGGPPFPLVYRLEGTAPLSFGELGYAREARASYQDFLKAREAGLFPPTTRFQVAMPTPANVVGPFVDPEHKHLVEPAYEAAMIAEAKRVCDAIPHKDLAIQWDMVGEVMLWDGRTTHGPTPPPSAKDEAVKQLGRLVAGIPNDVEVGFHLCYGDWGGRHAIDPLDVGAMVGLTNAIVQEASRPITYFHMPDPLSRRDRQFFQPFEGLKVDKGTEIYIGLLHLSDTPAERQERIDSAHAYLPDFGLATECGLGRRSLDVVRQNLDMYSQAAKL